LHFYRLIKNPIFYSVLSLININFNQKFLDIFFIAQLCFKFQKKERYRRLMNRPNLTHSSLLNLPIFRIAACASFRISKTLADSSSQSSRCRFDEPQLRMLKFSGHFFVLHRIMDTLAAWSSVLFGCGATGQVIESSH
jgi:hypothetical protein